MEIVRRNKRLTFNMRIGGSWFSPHFGSRGHTQRWANPKLYKRKKTEPLIGRCQNDAGSLLIEFMMEGGVKRKFRGYAYISRFPDFLPTNFRKAHPFIR